MKKFECILVTDKDINLDLFHDKLFNTVKKDRIVSYEDLGIRLFAYPIRKMTKGRFINFKFTTHDLLNYDYDECMENNYVSDLELKFNSWNEIVKFIIVRCE